MKRCSHCQFSVTPPNYVVGSPIWCRRFPPQASMVARKVGSNVQFVPGWEFPIVMPAAFCGEFKQRIEDGSDTRSETEDSNP